MSYLRYPNGWAKGTPKDYYEEDDAKEAIGCAEKILWLCDRLLADRTQIGIEGAATMRAQLPVPRIVIDKREKRSQIPELLSGEGIRVVLGTLPIGDYAISERLIVERKASQDFAASIKTKRLFQQMADLRENCELPLLVIEGRNLRGVKGVKRKGLLGALALITVYYRIPVIFTQDKFETAEFLAILARRESLDKGEVFSIFTKRKAVTREDKVCRVVEALPDVGPKRARALLKKFGSLKGIFEASYEEMISVPGMGEGRALKLLNFIRDKVEE